MSFASMLRTLFVFGLLAGHAAGFQRAKQKNKYPRVIGAGFALTGEKTLGAALETMGYKVYQGWQYHSIARHFRAWNTYLTNKHKMDGFVFERLEYLEYNATVDFPCFVGYKEMMKWDPRGKVILTVIDGGGMEWARRFRAHQEGKRNPFAQHAFFRVLMFHSYWSWDRHWRWTEQEANLTFRQNLSSTFHGCDIYVDTGMQEHLEACAASYERHVEAVKEHVPPERLLVYNIKEGWEPLCNFLGAPIPLQPYWVNQLYEWWTPVVNLIVQLGQLFFLAVCSWVPASLAYSTYVSIRNYIMPHAKTT